MPSNPRRYKKEIKKDAIINFFNPNNAEIQ